MKFINNNQDVQIRIKEPNGYRWEIVKIGEFINLPKSVGLANGFDEVIEVTDQSNQVKPKTTEGQIGNKKVETKQIELKKKDYQTRLEKIKGIGKKTAKDIIKVFPIEDRLIFAISHNEELPFRDDVDILLRRKYGN